jgi:hypothetical protein
MKDKNKKNMINKSRIYSNCCDAPALVKGRTTLYYVCSKCLKACDGHIKLSDKEKNQIRKNEDF